MFFQLNVLTVISQLYWSSSDKLQEVWELWVKLWLTIKWHLSLFHQSMCSQSSWHDWLHIFNALAALQWKAPVPVARSYVQWLSNKLPWSQHTVCNCDHSSLMERDPNSIMNPKTYHPEFLLLILRLTAIQHHTNQFQFVDIVSADIGTYGCNAVTGFSITELLSHYGRPWTCKSEKPVSFPIDSTQFMLEH
jgi:hypothetical protein